MKPLVSILIPARNEEDNLPHLFQSLDGLQYSKEAYEIILGNDQSHDKTGELMDAYASQRPNVKVFHVSEEESILKGKTRVLDLLASEAQGEYLFFTDADMELPPYWISGLLKHFQGNTGVVVGVTTVKRDTFWGLMQGMEWLMALTLFIWFLYYGFRLRAWAIIWRLAGGPMMLLEVIKNRFQYSRRLSFVFSDHKIRIRICAGF